MPIQYVGGRTQQIFSDAVTLVSLSSLTGGIDTTARAGDVAVVAYSVANTSDRSLLCVQEDFSTSWNELVNSGGGFVSGKSCNYGMWWSPITTQFTCYVSSPGSPKAGVVAVSVWRGVSLSSTQDVSGAGASGSGTARPNGPSITPISAGAVVVVAGMGAGTTSATTYTSASPVQNFITSTQVGSSLGAMIGLGSIPWSGSGAVDPAQFGGGTTASGNSWGAITWAMRPLPNVNLTASRLNNASTVNKFHAVSPGVVALGTPRIDDADTVDKAHAITVGAVTVVALRLNDADTVDKGHAIVPGALSLAAPRIDDADTVDKAHAITVGVTRLNAPRHDNSNTVDKGHQIFVGVGQVLPPRINSENGMPGADVIVRVSPPRINDADSLPPPGVYFTLVRPPRYDNPSSAGRIHAVSNAYPLRPPRVDTAGGPISPTLLAFYNLRPPMIAEVDGVDREHWVKGGKQWSVKASQVAVPGTPWVNKVQYRD